MRPEFQAIVLSGGYGNRLQPLTEDYPKAMLPVINLPLIHFQLALLEHAGFTESIVVVNSQTTEHFRTYLADTYKGKLNVELVVLPEDCLGTADAIRLLQPRLTADFIVLSGDVVTDIPLAQTLALHRRKDSALTVLLTYDHTKQDEPSKGKQQAKAVPTSTTTEFTALDSATSRLHLMVSSAELDDSLMINRSVLRSCQTMDITTTLFDSHIYVFAQWVAPFLLLNPDISSLKYELVPLLLTQQFVTASPETGESMSLKYTWPESITSGTFSCYANTHNSGYLSRVNTVPMYLEANVALLKDVLTLGPTERFSPSTGQKSHVSTDCVVGRDVRLGEKAVVKRSVVGHHCVLGSQVRVSNSVIMDHVVIEDGCTIMNSVLCSNSHIKANSTLKSAQVTFGHTVSAGTTASGEVSSRSGNMDLSNAQGLFLGEECE